MPLPKQICSCCSKLLTRQTVLAHSGGGEGHNRFSPCHMCNMTDVRVPDSQSKALHVPLDCSHHPAVRADPEAVLEYDPANLPLCSHDKILCQARKIDIANTEAEASRLAAAYRVKGISVLSTLSSVSFPKSFPFDFMHLIYENVLKNLILL